MRVLQWCTVLNHEQAESIACYCHLVCMQSLVASSISWVRERPLVSFSCLVMSASISHDCAAEGVRSGKTFLQGNYFVSGSSLWKELLRVSFNV